MSSTSMSSSVGCSVEIVSYSCLKVCCTVRYSNLVSLIGGFHSSLDVRNADLVLRWLGVLIGGGDERDFGEQNLEAIVYCILFDVDVMV